MSTTFVDELARSTAVSVAAIVGAGQTAIGEGTVGDAQKLLQIALANEISVSELAATWVRTTPEIDVKIAFARQAGDEAGHFELVAARLVALGFDLAQFREPDTNPLFRYMSGLQDTVERIAAGLFTLEAIAYGVNENFMAFCRDRGDTETVQIYETIIQPEERAHHELGQRLLAKYATTSDLQELARDVVTRVLEIAAATRATAATRLGIACFPGC